MPSSAPGRTYMWAKAEQRSGPAGVTPPTNPMKSSTAKNEDGQRNANRKPLSAAGSRSPGIHLIGDSCQSVSGQEMVLYASGPTSYALPKLRRCVVGQ